jgi:hypothetical protein
MGVLQTILLVLGAAASRICLTTFVILHFRRRAADRRESTAVPVRSSE